MTASEADKPDSGASRTATVPRSASPGQLARRARVPQPALQGLLALAVYLAVFLIGYAFPLLLHPGLPQVGQTEVDPNFYIWSWRWWPYALSHGLNPLHSSQIGAPSGFDLAWTTTAPAVAVILTPVTAAFGPITSFNLTLVLAAPVSAWVAFLAARRLTGRFWAALMAGAVYGFSPYEVGHTGAGQANLAVIMLLPLMVYLALLWRDGKLGRIVFVGLMAVTMAAEFYIFDEAFAEMAAAVGGRPADRLRGGQARGPEDGGQARWARGHRLCGGRRARVAVPDLCAAALPVRIHQDHGLAAPGKPGGSPIGASAAGDRGGSGRAHLVEQAHPAPGHPFRPHRRACHRPPADHRQQAPQPAAVGAAVVTADRP